MSMDPHQRLINGLQAAMAAVLGPDFAQTDPVIRPTSKPEHGDWQCNAAMSLGKRVNQSPRELAGALVEAADLDDLVESMEVAGPGFINIRLRDEAIAGALDEMDTEELGVELAEFPRVVVIDMCGVNVAKQMHVGHLRSTIIGDSFARILTRIGHRVHRENHLGDWGLPIAMVLFILRRDGVDLDQLNLGDLDQAYRSAQAAAKMDVAGFKAAQSKHVGPHRLAELEAQNSGATEFREAAGETLVALQNGNQELVHEWNKLISITQNAMTEAVDLLGVDMTPDDNRGESFYRDLLSEIIDHFESQGLARTDDGALVVDFEDRTRPLLIQKRDGGYLYATTDLAAVRVRTQETGASECIYVVDARQKDHFRDVFDAADQAGWSRTPNGEDVRLVHTGFGSVLGPDKKPLKTRSGENVTLATLLHEAIDRGRAEVRRRAEDPSAPTHDLDSDQLDAIGRAVGIGAVKYADLSSDLIRDYVFDLDRMVAFEGDTGPYLQYAHARICSILRRAGEDPSSTPFPVKEPAERALALILLRWNQVVQSAANRLEPHLLAHYLREVAEAFNGFYQSCPVIKADDEELKRSRVRLCGLTGRVLADGLHLLGIEAPECM